MKKDIHPEYRTINVKLVSGDIVQMRTSAQIDKAELALDVDPSTHPAWTGDGARLMDTGGRVSKFKEKFKGFGF